jgi:hypothetical protein
VPVHQDRVGGDLGEGCICCTCCPRRRRWRLDGVRYESEDAFRAALRKRDERPARIMALVMAERGGLEEES